MLMALLDLIGMRTTGTMHALMHTRPREALRVGARSLRSGVGPLLRLEVAIWALLQSIVVWMAVVTAMLLGGCASFDGSRTRVVALDGTQLETSRTLGAATVNAAAATHQTTGDLWPTDRWLRR